MQHSAVRALAEDGQKEKQSHADIQQRKNQIAVVRGPLLLRFSGKGQQLLAGEQAVDRDAEECRDGLQRIDAGIASAGFPFGDCGSGYVERSGKLLLREGAPLSQLLQFFVKFHGRPAF